MSAKMHLYSKSDITRAKEICRDNNINYDLMEPWSANGLLIIFSVENVVLVEKQFIKKNVGVVFFNYEETVCGLLKNKLFEDFTYIVQKYQNDHVKTHIILENACRKYDIECVMHVLSLARDNPDLAIKYCAEDVSWREGDHHDIMQLLFDHEINVIKANTPRKELNESLKSELDKLSERCLPAACQVGNYNIVRLLSEHCLIKKDPKYVWRAINFQHIEIAEYLISDGFSFVFNQNIFIDAMKDPEPKVETVYFYVNQLDSEGKTILNRSKTLAEGFLAACGYGHLETVMALVEIGVDADKYKSRALAKSRGRKEIQSYLKKLE